ncbi:hypothetical protein RRF57_003247 [Xylaria bambusicola]|uniref:Uncharacterized protein n=1 Tax=Xylaria bambusicola TaxID=326684 RepID=A0AAN7Z379_9PEZI
MAQQPVYRLGRKWWNKKRRYTYEVGGWFEAGYLGVEAEILFKYCSWKRVEFGREALKLPIDGLRLLKIWSSAASSLSRIGGGGKERGREQMPKGTTRTRSAVKLASGRYAQQGYEMKAKGIEDQHQQRHCEDSPFPEAG